MAEAKPIMRLFISQPMAGRSDGEIFKERSEVRDRVQGVYPDRHVVLIPSILSEAVEGVKPPLWYLGASLALMSEADMVYMAPGWASARGCVVEHLAARSYGLEVAYFDFLEDAEEDVSEGE